MVVVIQKEQREIIVDELKINNTRYYMVSRKIIDMSVGIMSILVILYRIIYLMIPMITSGLEKHNYSKILGGLSLIV